MFTSTSNGLPLNSELHKLPPLPETPAQTFPPKQSSYGGLSRTNAAGLGLPSSMRLQDLRELVEEKDDNKDGYKDKEGCKVISNRKWEVEVEYPVLSTRQGGINPPVGRTPSRDYLRGLPPTTTKPERNIVQPRTSSNSSTSSSPVLIRPTVSPMRSISKSPSEAQLTPVSVHACHTISKGVEEESHIPQVKLDTSLEDSIVMPSQSSPQVPQSEPQPSPESQPQPQPQPRLSASFNLPTYIADASLIADCSLMGGSTSVVSDDSFDLPVDRLRPQAVTIFNPAPQKRDLESSCSSSRGSDTPTKASSTLRPSRTDQLDQSTLLPKSPAKSAHLLASTNALVSVQPPWFEDDSDVFSASVSSVDTISPGKASSSLPKSQTMRGFPTSNSAHSAITGSSTSKTKRTFPSSSSGQSLSSVGEEAEQDYPAEAEMSTLLPVSPVKTAHLLTDEELIAKETLMEEASFTLPLPIRATPFKTSTMPHRSPRRSPKEMSPLKNVFPAHMRAEMMDEGDVTVDVKDLIAKVGKPKRASGTEESFVDLLHDDFMPDGLDASMMGPDDSMLPSTLRPRSMLAGYGSPVKHYTQMSPVRPQRERQSPTTIKRFPIPQTSRIQTLQEDQEAAESRSATISRSKSLSRVAEIIERVKSERATAHASGTDQAQPRALPRTEVRPRTYTTTRTPAPVPASTLPTTARPRSSMMPPLSAASRRISLSTGALPLPSDASHKVELPAPRATHTPTASTVSQLEAASAATSSASRSTSTSRTTLGTSTSSANSSATRTAVPPTRESTTVRARPSLAPTNARTELKTRTGSTSSTVTTSAALPSLPTARSSARTTFKPTSIAASSTSARTSTATTTSARLARPSVSAQPAGLPQPGTGPSARSAPTTSTAAESRSKLSRGFGTDASSTANSVARASTVTSAVTKPSSKLSTGPSATATATARNASTATSTAKCRAVSTPATTVAGSRAVVPPVPTSSRLTRPSLGPASAGVKKTSMPPTSSTTTTSTAQRPRVGSTLPRPPTTTSRVSTTTGGKASAPPTSGSRFVPTRTTAPGAPPVPAAGTNLAALRMRLDALQARQARVAK
ncbi:hypothetical protein IAT40_001386 [Kwoniella sp. CBS 6097]